MACREADKPQKRYHIRGRREGCRAGACRTKTELRKNFFRAFSAETILPSACAAVRYTPPEPPIRSEPLFSRVADVFRSHHRSSFNPIASRSETAARFVGPGLELVVLDLLARGLRHRLDEMDETGHLEMRHIAVGKSAPALPRSPRGRRGTPHRPSPRPHSARKPPANAPANTGLPVSLLDAVAIHGRHSGMRRLAQARNP